MKSKSDKKTSDKLHNENCLAYLKKVQASPYVLAQLPENIQQGLKEAKSDNPSPEFPYGDVYTSLFKVMEEKIDDCYMDQNKDHIKDLDNFVISLYDNDNQILEHTYESIKHLVESQRPGSEDMEKKIEYHVRDRGANINKKSISPAEAGSGYERFMATFLSNTFKPQHTTSLATVRHYAYNINPDQPKEYRFGTQGQRHESNPRISPLFKNFLEAELRLNLANKETPHIYFNNLARNRTDMEGKKEAELTLKLESLETNNPNIVVVTLPADKGFLSKEDYKKTKQEYSVAEVQQDFLKIALQNETGDFYISDNTRNRIFPPAEGETSEDAQTKGLKQLIADSFKTMGIDSSHTLSAAERQAVWFHFIKFELTDHIIKAVKPKSFNFSCKDAIDRGGVSSAYYNLINSFDSSNPMTQEEFNRGLHAAPTMVKGRGMNHHAKLIWNAVDQYVNANKASLTGNKAWLIEWRDLNCPHARAEGLIQQRTKEDIETLNSKLNEDTYSPEQKKIIKQAVVILESIQAQRHIGSRAKGLLLEATILTTKVALDQSDNTPLQERYQKIGYDLKRNYPKTRLLTDKIMSFIQYIASKFGLKSASSTEPKKESPQALIEKQLDSKQELQKFKLLNQPKVEVEAVADTLPTNLDF